MVEQFSRLSLGICSKNLELETKKKFLGFVYLVIVDFSP